MRPCFRKMLLRLFAVAVLCSPATFASEIPVGFISWDVTIPGSAGEFDITNDTGPNSSPPSFPITNTVSLSGLSLVVDFSNGSSTTYGPSYFTLALDGESFNGASIAIGGTNPLPTSATLTGDLSPTTIDDPGTDTILSTFTANILPSSPPDLSDGDFAIINATEAPVTTPEPCTLTLLGIGIFGLIITRRRLRSA